MTQGDATSKTVSERKIFVGTSWFLLALLVASFVEAAIEQKGQDGFLTVAVIAGVVWLLRVLYLLERLCSYAGANRSRQSIAASSAHGLTPDSGG